MTDRPRASIYRMAKLTCALLLAACSSSGGAGGTGGGHPNSGGSVGTGGAASPGTGGAGTGSSTGGTIGGGDVGGSGGAATGTGGGGDALGSGGHVESSGGNAGTSPADGGGGGGGTGGKGGKGGLAGANGGGQPDGGIVMNSCVGKMVPTADPTKVGPFEITAEKMVGPVAGAPNDPLYQDTPVRFNVYRPKDLATGGYCFPIIIWSNGHQDQPEPVPSVGCNAGKCGRYLPLLQQFASHGFVVVVSLSSQTSKGDPLPSMVGLDWILKQAEDSTSPYYHHLDTSHIGAGGHSEGGFTSCKMASDPRFSTVSTVAGSGANPGFHQPVLLFCGGMDPTVSCSSVETSFKTITNLPAMFINNESTNHLNWATQGLTGPTLLGFLAWFRVHLMNDTENRKYFYGPTCTFCSDSRVTVERNTLMLTP